MRLTPEKIELPTRKIDPALVELLQSLQEGDRIVITQKVRVGGRKWETVVKGKFRCVKYLCTGITTERVPEDDVVVPTVHFVKDNNEMASIAIDLHTRIAKDA